MNGAHLRLLLALALAPLVLTACSPSATPSSPGGQRVSVAVSFYPLEYLANRVGGDRVTVKGLVPAGVEPHDWEPSAQDIVSITNAQLFIYNGAGFEPWAERVAKELPRSGPQVLAASDGVADHALPTVNGEAPEFPSDPHVWLDPIRYIKMAERVRDALAQADPAGVVQYDANLATLRADLDRLDSDFRQGLASCERRTIVTMHVAFGYLAHRYSLEGISIAGLSPEAEPSPARLKELVQQVRERGATTIFFEELVSPAVAQTIAKEVGATTAVLSPLEILTPEQRQAGEDYLSVMRKNLDTLRTALGCR